MSIPLCSSPNLIQKSPFTSIIKSNSQKNSYALRRNHLLHFRCSSSRFQPLTPYSAPDFTGFSINKPLLGFSLGRKLGFSVGAENGEGETKSVVDEAEEARGQSTMPSRFRYLTKEAPDRPVRWPWLIALAFLVYAWRSVLWELSNWKKAVVGIARFTGYLSKLALAIVFHFFGDPITAVLGFIETSLYSVRSIYSDIVASAPVSELTIIILLTSIVLAVAEATVPDSVNSQPYLLAVAGLIGFAAVKSFIPEVLFWVFLVGLFFFSKFIKKRDGVSSALPVAAVLAAVGEPWVRVLVITLYLSLAIYHHSKKKLSEENAEIEVTGTVRRLPVPLVGVALVIGIHVAAKWVRYRHLTWMIA
ncbi:hypothetical protein BVC80_4713g1 [Macleaya cordata]|uniref:Embryo defective n=1 Tax=Macleaya cordata TaxID=56857 RepID=A0A200QK78_MACCD|nr:hypothetical protein BVC80_4713g1 [Macleaya cordata]